MRLKDYVWSKMDLFLTPLPFMTSELWTSNQVQFTYLGFENKWFVIKQLFHYFFLFWLLYLFEATGHDLTSIQKTSFKVLNCLIFTFSLRWCGPANSENNLIFYIGIGKPKFSGFCLASENWFSGIIYFLPIFVILKSKVKQYFKTF